VTLNANNISVNVVAGKSYDINALRIVMALAYNALPVDTTLGAINYVCIKHIYEYSGQRGAYKTGASFYANKYDSYALEVKTQAQGPPSALEAAGYVVLATTTGTGSSVTISTSDRTKPDFSGAEDLTAPSQVIGVTLATGPEPSLVYNGASNPIASMMVEDDLPVRAYIQVNWAAVIDPSGIARYELELVPLEDDDTELPDYLESARLGYNYI
jgi:hypothetical protein